MSTKANIREHVESLGYRDLRDMELPEEIPHGFEVIRVGDQSTDSTWYWSALRAEWVLASEIYMIQEYNLVHIKPSEPKNIATVWHCHAGSCRGRENDTGHCCYWCGSKEQVSL